MTDTDIIKALECCAGSQILCKDCIYRNSPPYPACKSAAARQALDLINRQKAEIERLRDIICVTDKTIKKACALAKNEAFKEFADRLKKEKIKPEFPWDDFYITETTIDNLVKEMTEDKA